MSDAFQREFDSTDSMLTKKGIAGARENGHVVRRTVKKQSDEVVGLDSSGDLVVTVRPYTYIESVADYYCTCGAIFDDGEGAKDHLHDAANGVLDDPRDD